MGTQLIEEYEDAASNSYSAGTTPGSAPGDSGSTILYQHSDHLTTRLTTENNGQLSNEQAHYPFGEIWYQGGTANPSVLRKYTSYLRDDEASTGRLNYAVFREHSARIGRFHMADPRQGRGDPQKLNRYAYVANDAVNRIDPRGLIPGGTPGWPGWGQDEIDQCVDPQNPLCGNHAFWSSIRPLEDPGGSINPDTRVIDLIAGVIGQFLPGWFPRFWEPQNPSDCTVTYHNKPILGSICEKGEVFIKEWECNGEKYCCLDKKRDFIDWCGNLPKKERPDLEYGAPRERNWWPNNVQCCGGLKKKKLLGADTGFRSFRPQG